MTRIIGENMAGHSQAGFTIVDLMAGLAGAGIVMLTAGLFAIQSVNARLRGVEELALQRDASLARLVLSRSLRSATSVQWTSAETLAAHDPSGVVRTLFVRDGDRRLVYRSGSASGASMVVTDHPVAEGGFTSSNLTGGVWIRLVLEGPDGLRTNETVVSVRN